MKPITENNIDESAIELLLKPVYQRFVELYSKRLDRISVLMMGEDSIRYDFFSALTVMLDINTWEMQLEYPVHEESFIPRMDPKSKRKEKPQLDLVIINEKINAGFEFGLFKRNSNPNGTINKTGKTLKMLNDFVRLGLHSYYTGQESFFICVADSFMLQHHMDCKVYDAFPSKYYDISVAKIGQIRTAVRTESFFDERFFQKAEAINLSIQAKLIHEQPITSDNLEHLTKVLVWKIEVQK